MTMPLATIAPTSLAWNSLTMDAANWGLLQVDMWEEVRRVPVFSGADLGPRQIFYPHTVSVIRATLLDLYAIPAKGDISNMTVVDKGRVANRTWVAVNAQYEGFRRSQVCGTPGAKDLIWVCPWTDGVTNPITWS